MSESTAKQVVADKPPVRQTLLQAEPELARNRQYSPEISLAGVLGNRTVAQLNQSEPVSDGSIGGPPKRESSGLPDGLCEAKAQHHEQGVGLPRDTASPVRTLENRGFSIQRSIGNRGMSMRQNDEQVVQPKLKIGQPDDAYEREADRVADEVMRTWAAPPPVDGKNGDDSVQPKCADCAGENEIPKAAAADTTQVVRRLREDEEEIVQAKAKPDAVPQITPELQTGIGSLQGAGQPLPGSLRGRLEPEFGHDFSRVRIHKDSRAAGMAQALNARAFTVGDHVVFGEGQYGPHTSTGLHLLAHELTHVVQQGAAGIRLQRNGPSWEPPDASMQVSLSGIHFTLRGQLVFEAGPTRYRLMAVALKRLLGPQYRERLEYDVFAEIDRQGLEGTGGLSAESTATEGQQLASATIDLDIGAANFLVNYLSEDLNLTPQLSEDQRRLLRLGLASESAYSQLQSLLPDWYSLWIFQREIALHQPLLEDYERVHRPVGSEQGRQRSLDAILGALSVSAGVLESIRVDFAICGVQPGADDDPLTRVNKEQAPGVYKELWGIPAETTSIGVPPEPRQDVAEELKVRFLRFTRSQPQLTARVRENNDHSARVELLGRFARIDGRTLRGGDGDERLLQAPPTANSPAWPATLTSSPPLQPPLYNAVLRTDHRFSMNLQFGHWLDAFAFYVFEWERIRLPDPPPQESETTPVTGPDLEQMQGERPSLGEVFDTRMTRTLRYNAADLQRIREFTGVPFGTGAHDLVEFNNVMRIAGTITRLGLERLTMPSSESQIVFPDEGLYVVRCRASPVLEGDEAVVRPPSIAYQPVVAVDPEQLAVSQVQAAARTEFSIRMRIAEIQALFAAPFPPENAEDLRAELEYLQNQLLEPHQALAARRGELERLIARIRERISLRGQIRTLEQRRQSDANRREIDALRRRLMEIGGPGSNFEDERALRGLESQLEDVRDLESTRETRNQRETGPREVPITSFVSDLGHSIPLSIELYDRGVVDNKREVFISDITTPRSGVGLGQIDHAHPDSDEARRQAIEAAFMDLLENSSDYGRGYVSYRVDGQIFQHRVEAGTGRLLSEALESAATVVSIAAIAAAPFTAGQSLYLLLPLGALAAMPSAYRIYHRIEADTFRWFDLDIMMDILNIVGGVVGLAQVATPLRMVRMGTFLMVMGVGADGAGIILMGAGLVQQITDLQDLSEGERAARLIEILAGAFVQLGIQAGGMVAHARYRPGGEGAAPRGQRGVPDTPGFHRPAADADVPIGTDVPGTPRQTTGGLGDPPRQGGAPPPPSAATEAPSPGRPAAQAREQVLSRLGEGVDRSLPPPRPEAVSNPQPNNSTYRRGIQDAEQALTAYNEAVAAAGGREVGLYQNPHTGEFLVRIGDEVSVGAPPREHGWQAVVHYHPNPGNVLTYRLPAPADFNGLLLRYMAEGGLVREFVEFDIPGVGRGRTEFGIDGGNPAEPFYVTINYPDGTARTLRFAHDGAYHVYWGSRTRAVVPGSPEYRQMIQDIQRWLRQREAESGQSQGGVVPPPQTGQTTGGTGGGRSPLMAPDGSLTPTGIQFIRDNIPEITDATSGRRRVLDVTQMSDAEIQRHFRERPSWLEAIVTAEARGAWLGHAGTPTDFLMSAPRQDFRTVANRLEEGINAGSTGHALDRSVLTQSAGDFINGLLRAHDPVLEPAYNAAARHPDPSVRARFQEFLWSQERGNTRGFMFGEVGRKQPDLVEVRLSQNEIAITDATFAVGDPVHNFKSAFYMAVMQRLIGGVTVTSTDFRGPGRQTPVGP